MVLYVKFPIPQYKNIPSPLFSFLPKLYSFISTVSTRWHLKSPFDYKNIIYFHFNVSLLVSSVNKLVYSNIKYFDASLLW